MPSARIEANRVHATLARHMLADGYDLVLDLEKSRERRLYDARRKRWFLDFFSFFASCPVGLNHPALHDRAFEKRLLDAARHKPSNPEIFTAALAEFVATFSRVAIPKALPHLFLIEGGALAVENALKAAFDWKVRKNLAAGRGEKGSKILHFREAFHGRTGYTLSVTNTADPRKIQYFPKFPWPRVTNPKMRFPLTRENIALTVRDEERAVREIESAFRRHRHDVAAILIEPIQSEGGDNHFRGEFMKTLRRLADKQDALLIFDEVQTGVGLTGKMWCYQHFGVAPDILCFGKKMQVCGILAGRKIDEVKDNVFCVKSRINSTWGGNLVDMVRATRFLEIIQNERLVANAAGVGRHLLSRLAALAGEFPWALSNPRGRGLMCALDFSSGSVRDRIKSAAYRHGLLILPCGEKSLRFRPPLDITAGEIDEGIAILRDAIRSAASHV